MKLYTKNEMDTQCNNVKESILSRAQNGPRSNQAQELKFNRGAGIVGYMPLTC